MKKIIKRPSLAFAMATQREHELDSEFPYKITAPRLSITPLRYSNKKESDEIFESISSLGEHQAIYTFTNLSGKKCKTKIIGYSSGKVKRKE